MVQESREGRERRRLSRRYHLLTALFRLEIVAMSYLLCRTSIPGSQSKH